VKSRPPKIFSAVPKGVDGKPMNVAGNDENYAIYLDWLADYLHRPSSMMPPSANLSLEKAWSRVSRIESEIAEWIWQHPFDDYPPDNYQPRHSDILHRVELCRILSRVLDHADRRELLHRFYRELNIDLSK
jgi:hypothetical protein